MRRLVPTPEPVVSQEEQKEKLSSLIQSYKLNDTELKSYDKICKEQNKEIKSLMKDMDLTEFDTGMLIATVTTSTREDFDSDMLLAYIKKNGLDKCVKTVEMVDMEVLESMIYNSEIPEDILTGMGSCKTSKEVVTLRIKEKKRKKADE